MTTSYLLKKQSHLILLLALFLIIVPCQTQNCTAKNCTVCNSTDPNVCLTCEIGFFQVGNGCCKTDMQFCTGCNVNSSVCDGCSNSSLCKLNSTSCISCSQAISDCITCSSCTDCTLCPSNYLLNASKKCEKCDSLMPKCDTCSSATNCVTCISGYSKKGTKCCSNSLTFCLFCNTNSEQCDSCISNTYCKKNSTGCVICSAELDFCITCNSCTACVTCQTNYIVNSTSKCELCSDIMPKCQTCTSTTACTTCVTGYAKIGTKCCLNPMPFCTGCVGNPDVCDSCTTTSYCKVNSTSCGLCSSQMTQCLTCTNCNTCLTCAVNYGINTSSLCQLCTDLIIKCQTCPNKTSCTTCITGYSKIGANCCLNPMPFCTGCTSHPDICDGCTTTSYCQVNSTACDLCSKSINSCLTCTNCTFCLTCASTYGIDTSSTCTLCTTLIDHCYTCTSYTNCQTCINASYVLNTTLRCDPCISFLNNCEQCSSQTICTRCVDNTFAINASNKCQPCIHFMQFCTHCNNRSICIACVPSADVTLSPRFKCQYCPFVIPFCLQCKSAIFCTQCSNYYALKQSGAGFNCVSCLSQMARCFDCYNLTTCKRCTVGTLVQNGCSSVVGCLKVTQSIVGGPCVSCSTQQFLPNAFNDTCICKHGYLAGQHCTTVAGCSVADFTPSANNCRVCDLPRKFIEKQGNCICQTYFQKVGEVCKEICGDGKVLELACDDGNLIDGDGCSSACRIEPHYSCKRGDNNGASKCRYEGNIVLQLFCVYKSVQMNTAEVVFNANPYISNLEKSNFRNITLETSLNITLSSIKATNNRLTFYLLYFQDVDGLKITLTLNYDEQYINSLPQTKSFSLKDCNGQKFFFLEPVSKLSLFMRNLSQGLSIFSVIVWFLCSYSHKMIGVQTINAIQILAITQIYSQNYQPNIEYASGLSATVGFFQSQIVEAQILRFPSFVYRLGYSVDIIGNLIFVGLIQIISVFIYGIVTALKDSDLFQETRKRYNITGLLERLKEVMYGFIVFPINVGFFLHILIAVTLQNSRQIEKSQKMELFQFGLLFCSFIIAGVVFMGQWKYLIVHKGRKGNKYKDYYVSAYLSYIFLNGIIVVLSTLSRIIYPIHCLAALQLLFLIFLIIKLPYQDLFSNISLIVNQVFVLLNSSFILTQLYLPISSRIQLILIYLVFSIVGIIDILGLVRGIISLRNCWNKVVPDYREIKRKERLKRLRQLQDDTTRQIQNFLKKETDAFISRVEYEYNKNILKDSTKKPKIMNKQHKNTQPKIKYENRNKILDDIESNDLLKQPLKNKK